MDDTITAQGTTTSEFRLTLAFLVLLGVNAYLRATYGVGLTELEMGYAVAATGGYGFGRYDLKKTVAKVMVNGNGKAAPPPPVRTE